MEQTETDRLHSRFEAFRIMWLLFILFHMAISSPGWTRVGDGFLNPGNYLFLALNVLVVIFSLVSLFRPRRLGWFWGAMACLVLVKLEALPSVPNHIILTLIILVTLFLSLPLFWDRNLSSQRERVGRWFDRVAPYLRIELLILYFFVVLHKLNTDFFNPEVSCATALFNEIATLYPLIPGPEWMEAAVIPLTLLPELLIPLFLLIPSLRVAGIFMGLIFHFLLSLHPNLYILSFTAELYALYVLFLPEDLAVRLCRTLERIRTWLTPGKLVIGLAAAGPLLAVHLALRGWTVSLSLMKQDALSLVVFWWVVWSLLLMTAAFIAFRGRFITPPEQYSRFFRLSLSPLLVMLVLTVLNGLTPYIGLKTATNFAMFSNLRAEGEVNNHLFMPAGWQVTDLQGDTVTLLEASHPVLQDYMEWDERITWFELERILYEHRTEPIEVTFLRNGVRQTIRLPEDRPESFPEYSWLARKLLIFRGVPREGSTPCQW